MGDLRSMTAIRVEAGEVLVRLDETQTQANLAMVDKSLDELFGAPRAVEAERDGTDDRRVPCGAFRAARRDGVARVIAGEHKLFRAAPRGARRPEGTARASASPS